MPPIQRHFQNTKCASRLLVWKTEFSTLEIFYQVAFIALNFWCSLLLLLHSLCFHDRFFYHQLCSGLHNISSPIIAIQFQHNMKTVLQYDYAIYSLCHFHCLYLCTCQNLVKALFTVLFSLVPSTHAPNHSVACNFCHTWVKALLVEPLLLCTPVQSIVLALLS